LFLVTTWQRGAEGERRTARLLDRLAREGYVVFHDLAAPGSPANVDCMIPSAAVAVRSDPNADRPGALRVDLSTGAVEGVGVGAGAGPGDHHPVPLGQGVGQVLGLATPDIHAQEQGVAVAPLAVLLAVYR
jgi:hypothetical protein